MNAVFGFRSVATMFKTFPWKGFDDEIKAFGLVPIGEGEDGDFWVVRASEGLNGPVYHVEHTAWGPGIPTFENGLTCAALSFPHLLCGLSLRRFGILQNHHTELTQDYTVNSGIFSGFPSTHRVYDF
ncbi:MAG: hypothetical protein JNM65_02805 [Verrucomicrobiaceae bacterium]|nr:hypothetical protein [Verrucomicrobiaceae bacterium]